MHQELSCLEGETEPDDKLEGDGGVGDDTLWGCQGTVPGGDNVTGTTFFTTIVKEMHKNCKFCNLQVCFYLLHSLH